MQPHTSLTRSHAGPPRATMLPMALLMALLLATPAVHGAQQLEQIVALVDDDLILSSEFARFKAIQYYQQSSRSEDNDKALLDALIMRRIQLGRARQQGIRASDNQINERITQLARQNNTGVGQLLTQLGDFPGGVRGFRDYLYNNLVLEQFQRSELQNLVGVTEDEARAFLLTETGQKMSQLLYQVGFISIPKTTIKLRGEDEQQRLEQARLLLQSDAESTDFATLASTIANIFPLSTSQLLNPELLSGLPSLFANQVPLMRPGEVAQLERGDKIYLVKLLSVSSVKPTLRDEVRLRHLVLYPSTLRNSEQTEVELNNLHQRIAKGENFARLAAVYSEDSATANNGGMIDWISYDLLDPALAQVAQTLPLGQLSQPIETTQGFELVEVLERARRDRSEELELSQIRQFIFQQKLADELPRLMAQLKQSAFIEIKPPYVSPDIGKTSGAGTGRSSATATTTDKAKSAR